ncbi:MAG: hypothetical protein M1828_007440 [Chrysothrix sp. TS-e1954]|nr:MAG: hypothetical protein M1828_007440 [Chrysothrix sp. TS-e1954]
MAAIGLALWRYVMQYNPENPSWFARDRFVLSNGHCCLFQYMFLHLTGYKAMTWNQLKSYHSVLPDSIAPGHPEVEIHGIEVTTGPLGQGVANAVGLAMATENLAATYNRDGFAVVDNMTYCMMGDACLQEGVGLEAISLAGHWRLKRLVILYDNNQITCDGSVDMVNNEDINAKMQACGFDVIDIEDGCYDVTGIVSALEAAKIKKEDKPTFINIHTIIGVGSAKQGEASTHGAAFGAEDVRYIKTAFDRDPDQHFLDDERLRAPFADVGERGEQLEKEHRTLLERYKQAHPDLAAELQKRINGEFTSDPAALVPPTSSFSSDPFPTRKSAGLVLKPLTTRIRNFMPGTCDLTPSIPLQYSASDTFQHPSLSPQKGPPGSYAGRYIHYGIREHAMASIANGLSAYAPGCFVPITSSFFMFYIYAAPGVRMGALQRFQQIHIATHDSIGTGEDGPTHQPIELAALYRAMPNFLYIRPADSEEVAGAVELAMSYRRTPSMLSLSRQNNPQYFTQGWTRREGVKRGGYVMREEENASVTLVGAGAELKFAINAADSLLELFDVRARVVSMPCMRVFDRQETPYRREVLRRKDLPVVAIEAYSMTGWERYADAGYGMSTFGHSLPGEVAYKHFGFSGEHLAGKIKPLLDMVQTEGLQGLRAEGFQELNSEGWAKAQRLMDDEISN